MARPPAVIFDLFGTIAVLREVSSSSCRGSRGCEVLPGGWEQRQELPSRRARTVTASAGAWRLPLPSIVTSVQVGHYTPAGNGNQNDTSR
jgi:hypothetical protein